MPEARPLSLTLTHPAASSGTGPLGTWYVTELPSAELDRLLASADPVSLCDELVHRNRDASVLFVRTTEGVATTMTAWRGLTSGNEVYYAHLPDGGWYFSDHFRNAVAMLPEDDRKLSDEALLQHYVGAAVFGRVTYARRVDRLMYGDRIEIDLRTGATELRCFSRHEGMATDEPMERRLDRLDGALEDVMAPLNADPGVGVGFSGGVDSTLLLSYLGDSTPLTILPGSPEFDVETEYAREAAGLLGREITEIRLDEGDYATRLGDYIETVGMLPRSYVTPIFSSLYEYPMSAFVVGEGGDSAFGSGRGIRRVASALSGPLGRATLKVLGVAPGPVGRRAEQLTGYANLFRKRPGDPDGYAGMTLVSQGDMSHTTEMFGDDAVDDLGRRMLDDVQERVHLEASESDGFFQHIELAQWRVLLSDLALGGNHYAQSLGKREVQPFTNWCVLREALRIPIKERYYKGLAGKWMLKELLGRRVAGYRPNKKKLSTALPFDRYVRSGPLADFWDHYEIPAVIPPTLHTRVRATSGPLTWMAMNHALIEERVVRNGSLEPFPAALAASWPTAASA